MDTSEIMMLRLGLQDPWILEDQQLKTDMSPYQLHLTVSTQRGQKYPCPCCGEICSAHDFIEKSWRHLNFFEHHCYLIARVPRIKCSNHGVKMVSVPWARKGSGFTLLFEGVVLSLAREMPVQSISRITGVTDKRLWRVILHYVEQGLSNLDLSGVQGVALDETASKRSHNYVTTFIDMERPAYPVIFATAGRSGDTLAVFKTFLQDHDGNPDNVQEFVADMSPAFLSGIRNHFPGASVTVDWFHIVQKFVDAVDKVRKTEAASYQFPKSSRFALLKGKKKLTTNQSFALSQILSDGRDTARAWAVKEALGWLRNALSIEEAKERIDLFLENARQLIKGCTCTISVEKALNTLEKHSEKVLRRWTSTYTNARMEGFNSLFQAAKARARGYRNTDTFIAMIYMIGSPVAKILKST